MDDYLARIHHFKGTPSVPLERLAEWAYIEECEKKECKEE